MDVFGAGAVLYFALSNTLPFPGKSLKKVLELTAKCKVRYDPTLFGEYGGSIMQLLKALLQKDPNKRPSSKKSFISLWTLAKPDVRNSSAAKAAYQAMEDGAERAASRPAPVAPPSPTAVPKVVRTSSRNDVREQKAEAAATAPAAVGKSEAAAPAEATSGPEASTELQPKPPSAPKPSGSFSWMRSFGWGKSSSGKEVKDGES